MLMLGLSSSLDNSHDERRKLEDKGHYLINNSSKKQNSKRFNSSRACRLLRSFLDVICRGLEATRFAKPKLLSTWWPTVLKEHCICNSVLSANFRASGRYHASTAAFTNSDYTILTYKMNVTHRVLSSLKWRKESHMDMYGLWSSTKIKFVHSYRAFSKLSSTTIQTRPSFYLGIVHLNPRV